MAKVTPHKYAKGFTISFDGLPMEMVGDLVQPKVSGSSKEDSFVSVSPHDNARKLRRIYYDDVIGAEVAFNDVVKAKEADDGTLVPLSTTDVVEAKKSDLPERQLALRAYRRDDVISRMLVGEKRYVFQPGGSSLLYGVIQRLLHENPDFVFMGKANMGARSGEKILEVVIGLNGHLMVSELAWPEDVNNFDAPEWDCSDKMYETAEQLIAATIEQYDEGDFQKNSRQRISALVASASGGTVVVNTPAASQKNDVDTMQAALELALASLKSKSA